MTTCKTCGKSARKTVLAFIMGAGGKLRGARVCQDCERQRGVTIVVAPEVAICGCGKPATKCGGCSQDKATRDKGRDVGGAIKALRTQLGMYQNVELPPALKLDDETSKLAAEFRAGKIEGYENAIHVLEGGRW
jgi:hypothetical protein